MALYLPTADMTSGRDCAQGFAFCADQAATRHSHFANVLIDEAPPGAPMN